MDFKQQVQADITGVFINPSEFAEEHTIDGVTGQAVLDSDIFDKQTGLDPSMEYDGVFYTNKVLYIDESFFTSRPIEGQEMQVDSEYYFVTKVAANMGVLEIHLRQNST